MTAPEVASPSLVIITSDHQRHCYFANILAGLFPVRGVIAEEKSPLPEGEEQEAYAIIHDHFQQRTAAEERYFSEHRGFKVPAHDLLAVAHGDANSGRAFDWIMERKPEYLVLFGSSVIRARLLEAFDNRVINLHLGLSPYYRGVATNFWPLVDGLPECVGATIHLATLRVDAGAILLQARPDIEASDEAHDIGCKAIMVGATAMASALAEYHAGSRMPREQIGSGKLCRTQDFNAAAVVTCRKNFLDGMIPRYVADRDARRAKFPIVG